MIVAVAVVLLVASLFAGGFVLAMRDSDRWCHEELLDEIWDEEVAA